MKNVLRAISLTLVLALFIQILPMDAIAEEIMAPNTETAASTNDNPITGECMELRDKYTKVFERKDRSKIAVVSPEAIHYKKDGKFVDIDNTMVESGKIGNKVLTNTNNPLGVELPKTLNEDKEIKVSNEGYTLSFKFIEDLDSASAHVQKYKETKADKEREDINSQAYEKAGLNKKSSDVTYSGIMDNVDVEYVVQAEKLKENIIIKEKPAENTVFSYSINAPKLTATLNKDNSINFFSDKNKKDVVFYLPAPVMFDSNGVSSGDIKVELNKAAGGTYTMTYKPSMAWLSGSEIQYPITLDPVISSEKSTSGIDDTYVASDTPDTNYGTGTELLARQNAKVPLIKLNSLSIPTDAVITKVNLYLYNIVNGTGNCTMNVKGITAGSWTESAATWTGYTSTSLTKGNTMDSITTDLSIAGYVNWDITKLMKSWAANNTLSNGLLVETANSTTQDVRFGSSENADSLKRPYFTIEYRCVSGISYGNDNHTQSLGRAGTGYVNDFSGALTIERTDMSFGGSRMPAEIKWYYNSNERSNNIGYGLGVRNSYSESLQFVPASSTVPTAYYALKLGDGGTRYLDVLPSSSDANAPNVQDEQSGEKFTIRQLTVSGCTAYSLTDGEQTTKYYRRNDTSTATSKFLYKIEEVEDERITRVPATTGESPVDEHFTVRMEDGSEKTLYAFSYNTSTNITLQDKETGLFYTLNQITVNNNIGYQLEDNVGKIKRYAGTDTNSYTTKFLYQTEVSGTTTNVIIDSMQINVDFTSANGQINSIVDGAGRQYTFNYTNSILSSVVFKGTGTTSLSDIEYVYDSSNKLSMVTFQDDQYVCYSWSGAGNCFVQNIDCRYFSYSCLDNGQVSGVQEYSSDANDGNWIYIMYDVNETLYQDKSGNWQVEDFDQYGNTVATRDKNGNTCFGKYGGDSGKSQNLLLGKSNPRRPTENLFNNGGFEIASENAPISIPSPNSGVTVTPFYEGTDDNPAYAGKNCFKASYPGYTSNKQDITKTVTGLGIGKFYTLSFWVRTVGSNSCLFVSCSDGAGHTDNSKQIITNGKWQNVQVSSMTANGQANITISWYFGGSLYIDNMQLEQANPANSYNFVENSDFSDGGNHWADSVNATGNQTTTFNGVDYDVMQTPEKLDNNRRKLVGAVNEEITSYQRIPINGKAGETYSFGGWASARAALPKSDTNGRSLSIAIVVPSDITGNEEKELARIDYNTYITDWQFQEGSFTLDEDYSALLIKLIYTNELNCAYFDGIEFFKDALYKDVDAIHQVVNNSSKPETETEGSAVNPINLTTGSNNDAYGNAIKSYSTDGLDSIERSNTYTADGNYLASSTDELGNTTQNTYNTTQYPNNQQFGLITNVQDAKNNIINYCYDEMQRNTSVSQTISNPYFQVTSLSLSNTYTYNDNDNVNTITAANGTQYHYTYNEWGNIATVSVGSTTLATYTYSTDTERRLTQITYANGQSLLFDKSTENGINCDYIKCREVNGDTGTFTTIYYNDFGDVYSILDGGYYIKDNNGITEECASSGTVYHSYGQNNIQNGTEFLEYFNNPTKTDIKSTYLKDTEGYSSLAKITLNGNIDKEVNHVAKNDDFGRLLAEGISQGATGNTVGKSAIVSRYTYKNLPGLKTSNQVAAMSISRATDSNLFYKNYSYTYDTVGNITDIYDGTNLLAHYEYDQAGQLIRVNDTQQNKTFTYKYDASGNVLLKREYAYTTGTLNLPSFTDEIAYTYDTTWKDKLMSYDGSPVTYDASGNPLTYNGWTYSWLRGCMLYGMSKTGTTLNYWYNSDGIRIAKFVNGVKTSYTVVGSKITSQKTGDDSIYYFYDENDNLVSLNYAGTNYLYVKNLQGDIIAITDVDGNIVVEYTYDVWGKLLSTTGSMASTLGVANPFRYRGYFYDVETGLYYLQSRYYNPEWGRFVNADAIEYIDGLSLFSYCANNPLNRVDPMGKTSYIIGDYIIIPVIPDKFNDDEHYTGITKTYSDQVRYNLSKVAIDNLVTFYPNGCNFYNHFCENTGETYYYSYEDAYYNDDGIRKQMSIEINALVAVAKSKRGKRTEYNVYGTGWTLVNPTTLDWKLALGGHNVFVSAHVKYDTKTKLYDFDCTIYAIDRYNFSKSKKFLMIPGWWFVRFESLNMASYFWSFGGYDFEFQRK